MTKLSDDQHFLAAAFREHQPLTERDDLHADIGAIVTGNEYLTPAEQADIYRGQFWIRHRDVLVDDYPGLSYLLGEEPFEQLCRDYLDAHAPDSFTLRDLGNHMAEFCASYEGFAPDVAAAARDMARFELAFVDIFDGPDVEPLTIERVAELAPSDWVSAKLTFHPLLVLMCLDHRVDELRHAVRTGEQPSRELPPEPHWIALYRGSDLRVCYLPITEQQYTLLEKLRSGVTLGAACEQLALETDDTAAIAKGLEGWFRGWARRGWIVDVTIQR